MAPVDLPLEILFRKKNLVVQSLATILRYTETLALQLYTQDVAGQNAAGRSICFAFLCNDSLEGPYRAISGVRTWFLKCDGNHHDNKCYLYHCLAQYFSVQKVCSDLKRK